MQSNTCQSLEQAPIKKRIKKRKTVDTLAKEYKKAHNELQYELLRLARAGVSKSTRVVIVSKFHSKVEKAREVLFGAVSD